MDAHSPKNLDDDPPTREVPTEEPSRLAAWTDSVKSWWGEVREPEQPTRDPSDVPVACRLRGTTRFMHRSECLVQGGEPR